MRKISIASFQRPPASPKVGAGIPRTSLVAVSPSDSILPLIDKTASGPLPTEPPIVLETAIRMNDAGGVRKALELGADPNSILGTEGFPALVLATSLGHLEVVKELLGTAAINLNERTGQSGEIALQIACRHGLKDLVTVLAADPRAHLNLASSDGQRTTSLMIASQLSDSGCLEALLKVGGTRLELERRDAEGSTALDLCEPGSESAGILRSAVESLHSKPTILAPQPTLLASPTTTLSTPFTSPSPSIPDLSQPSRNNLPNGDVTSAHHLDFLQTCMAGSLSDLETFLRDPVLDVNSAEPLHGQTAFTVSCWRGRADVVSRLLSDERVDPNKKAEGGFTALMFAGIEGHNEVVKTLLSSSKVDVNRVNDQGGRATIPKSGHDGLALTPSCSTGNTALVLTARQAHLPIVKLLARHPGTDLSAGLADLVNLGPEIRHVIEKAAAKRAGKAPKRMQPILTVGATAATSPVLHAAPPSASTSPLNLIPATRSPGTSSSSLGHPLPAIPRSNSRSSFPVSPTSPTTSVDSAFGIFYSACATGDLQRVLWYLGLPNADPNRTSGKGWTGLHAACARGHELVVDRLLRDRRVNPSLRDSGHRTAFYLACAGNQTGVVKVLLRWQDRVDVSLGVPGMCSYKRPCDIGNSATKRLVNDGIARRGELVRARIDGDLSRERMEHEYRRRQAHEARMERQRIEEAVRKRETEERMRAAEFEMARRRQEDEERAIYLAQLEEQARIRRRETVERERERHQMEVEMRQMRELKRLGEELRIKKELLGVVERLEALKGGDVKVQKAVSFEVKEAGTMSEKENGGVSPAGGSADSELTVVEATGGLVSSTVDGRGGFIVG